MKKELLASLVFFVCVPTIAQVPDTMWTKIFGGNLGGDCGNSVQQTEDSGYIITGYTSPFGAGDQDIWLIKTNENGDTLWTKTFGGISEDKGYTVQQTEDAGYIIIGNTESRSPPCAPTSAAS